MEHVYVYIAIILCVIVATMLLVVQPIVALKQINQYQLIGEVHCQEQFGIHRVCIDA